MSGMDVNVLNVRKQEMNYMTGLKIVILALFAGRSVPKCIHGMEINALFVV